MNFWKKLKNSSAFRKSYYLSKKVAKTSASSIRSDGRSDGGFWKMLDKPIFALAPMEDVTDCAFREIFAKYGKPDVMFTEFVNVDGLCHVEGRKKLMRHLEFTEKQRPIVAQIWGRDPEKFFKAAQIIKKLKFDGIDINMGCPQDKEIKLKSCAALIREPDLAQDIINETKRGAEGLPISVKTRIGYSGNEIQKLLPKILEAKPATITIHARSKKDKSKVPARWEVIKEAVKIRNQESGIRNQGNYPLIIGNGDIKSREEGLKRIKETGCDGVMIARGAFGNPWIFKSLEGENLFHSAQKDFVFPSYQPSVKEKLQVMLEHTKLFEKFLGEKKPFVVMRKNFKAYVNGFSGAGVLRAQLMKTKNSKEIKEVIDDYFKRN